MAYWKWIGTLQELLKTGGELGGSLTPYVSLRTSIAGLPKGRKTELRGEVDEMSGTGKTGSCKNEKEANGGDGGAVLEVLVQEEHSIWEELSGCAKTERVICGR